MLTDSKEKQNFHVTKILKDIKETNLCQVDRHIWPLLRICSFVQKWLKDWQYPTDCISCKGQVCNTAQHIYMYTVKNGIFILAL